MYLTFQQLKKKMSTRSLSYKKFHKRQNYRKGDLVWRMLKKIAKN